MNPFKRSQPRTTKTVAVIGGGWAGCAAAVELAQRGHHVHLFESARTLGGRARGVELNGCVLDNGQHLLLGAYRETLRLMRVVGIDATQVMRRLPLQMRYPDDSDGMDFVAPRLPAPLHLLVALLRARGLAREDKMALARFSSTARWMDWQLHVDCSVTQLLERFDQTPRLIRLMWRPLCLAALNTPPDRASAQVFLAVLRDSLGAKRAASDMLIPTVDLTRLFPQHAAAHVAQRGGVITCGATISAIRSAGARWQIDGAESASEVDAVVIATQASHAADLLQGVIDTTTLTSLTYEPITTCYLQYPQDVRLPQPFLALADNPAMSEWGQFVFDRGQLDVRQAGLFAVVISASSAAIADGSQALTAAVAAQLARVLRQPSLITFSWSKVITEKRATFACTPGLRRPENQTGVAGLVLAGDYTAGDYPATIESAVRSGVQAARLIDA